jgi:hypothetical protein
VNEVCDQLGFPDEIVDELFLIGDVLPNDFDRDSFDKTASAKLLGFIDDAHAAFVHLAHDLVPKFILNREKCHDWMFFKPALMSSSRYLAMKKSPNFLQKFVTFFLHHFAGEL